MIFEPCSSPAAAGATTLARQMPAALLLAPLRLRGRARAAASFALAVTCAIALPFLGSGIPLGQRMLRDWRAKVVAPAAAGELQGSKIIDQSPQAALRRLLVNEPAFAGQHVNLAALEPQAFAGVSRAGAGGELAPGALPCLAAAAPAAPPPPRARPP